MQTAVSEKAKSCHQVLVEFVESRQKEAGDPKKRRPKGFARRPVKAITRP